MPPARVTFAIPCRDGAAHLGALVDSLLRQTRTDFEILLVDDASRDDSVAIARAHGGDRVRVVRNDEPLGLGGNWNRCAELVATPLFCIAHADDVYEPRYLERMTAALAAQPDAAFAHCRADTLDGLGRNVASPIERFKETFWRRCTDPDPATQFRLLRDGNFIMCPSALYRTDRFRAVGPFDPALRATLDWERHVRTALAGQPIVAVPDVLMHYRRHPRSVTSDNLKTVARYREEARLLRWIEARGRAVGWLDADAPPSRALRNNLLYDAYVDLCQGQPEVAALRLRFARDEERELAWDLTASTVLRLSRLGGFGRATLGMGLRAVLLGARLGYFIGARRRSSTTSRTNRA